MAHARILLEFDGLVYAVGPVRLGIALRAASSREFSLLRPFPTVAAAERMRAAMARAQVVEFADEPGRVDGDVPRRREPRKRRAGRRRRELRRPAELVSTPAARPSALPKPVVGASPSIAPRPIPRRSLPEDSRPTPDTVAALNSALDRLEAKSE